MPHVMALHAVKVDLAVTVTVAGGGDVVVAKAAMASPGTAVKNHVKGARHAQNCRRKTATKVTMNP